MSDDIFAAATERACARMSISVPDRLSIISFNNSLLARLTSSQLTSIDINPFRLGTESAEQLISLIGSHESCAKKNNTAQAHHTQLMRASAGGINRLETKTELFQTCTILKQLRFL